MLSSPSNVLLTNLLIQPDSLHGMQQLPTSCIPLNLYSESGSLLSGPIAGKRWCWRDAEQAILAIPILCRKTPFIHLFIVQSLCFDGFVLVHMSVCVNCSIGKKCFPFITYVYILFHAFSLPSCYIGTGTLLIDQLSYYWEFSVFNGCLWVLTRVTFMEHTLSSQH